MEEVRLQKFIADCGITSRRKAEELILQGKIKVNGKVVTELGTKINPQKDVVLYNNKQIQNDNKSVYILLNKPIGYVTTVKDQFSRNSVLDLVKVKERIVPVGRLDMYTSGALILTNDGDFVYQVTHPKHEIDKTYTVTINGKVTDEEVQQLKNGVKIEAKEPYITKPAKVKILKIDEENYIWLNAPDEQKNPLSQRLDVLQKHITTTPEKDYDLFVDKESLIPYIPTPNQKKKGYIRKLTKNIKKDK